MATCSIHSLVTSGVISKTHPPLCHYLADLATRHSYTLSMAEKTSTASEALKNLEQQLTCLVCLDRYTQPRTLPCLHSF